MNLDVEWPTIGFRNLRTREDSLQEKTPPRRIFVSRITPRSANREMNFLPQIHTDETQMKMNSRFHYP
jgi:hypothetical protein